MTTSERNSMASATSVSLKLSSTRGSKPSSRRGSNRSCRTCASQIVTVGSGRPIPEKDMFMAPFVFEKYFGDVDEPGGIGLAMMHTWALRHRCEGRKRSSDLRTAHVAPQDGTRGIPHQRFDWWRQALSVAWRGKRQHYDPVRSGRIAVRAGSSARLDEPGRLSSG